MRIGFFINNLFLMKGGSGRLSVNMAHNFLKRGHECFLFHCGVGDGTPAYSLNESIVTCNIDCSNTKSILKSKNIISQAQLDVFCVLYTNQKALLIPHLCIGTNTPLLFSEHFSPKVIETMAWNREERLACLAVADGIHMLSERYLPSLPESMQRRTTVIPNPAPVTTLMPKTIEKFSRKRLLAVGRLEDITKQFSILIKAFSLLAQDFPDWDCYICGEGIWRDEYEELIDQLHLQSRVILTGAVDTIEHYYASADIFCIPSAIEAFSLVLVEAQSYGLPAVGFQDCESVTEVIIHGENGLLVQERTPENLNQTLRELMKNADLRKTMGEKAQKLCARYDANSIYSQWEALLFEVSQQKDHTRLDHLEMLETDEHEQLNAVRKIFERSQPMAHPQSRGAASTGPSFAAALRTKLKRKND